MLLQDLHAGAIPYDYRGRVGFRAELSPKDEAVGRMVVRALSYGNRQGRDLTGAVREFLTRVIQNLIFFGEAYYEIGYEADIGNPERPAGFVLSAMPIHSLSFRFGRVYQTQPVETSGARPKSRRVRIPRGSLLHIAMPRQLGGPTAYRRMLRTLDRLGTGVPPDFAMAEFGKTDPQPTFDFEAYHMDLDLAVARCTSSVGWLGRTQLAGRVTEGCYFSRLLRYGFARALQREAALGALNEALGRAGPKLEFSATVAITGPPTCKDFEEAVTAYEAGKMCFDEVSAAVFGQRSIGK